MQKYFYSFGKLMFFFCLKKKDKKSLFSPCRANPVIHMVGCGQTFTFAQEVREKIQVQNVQCWILVQFRKLQNNSAQRSKLRFPPADTSTALQICNQQSSVNDG